MRARDYVWKTEFPDIGLVIRGRLGQRVGQRRVVYAVVLFPDEQVDRSAAGIRQVGDDREVMGCVDLPRRCRGGFERCRLCGSAERSQNQSSSADAGSSLDDPASGQARRSFLINCISRIG
ncbi:MAG: hypothetical protein ACRDQ1_08940 [Sciscionella sp.]